MLSIEKYENSKIYVDKEHLSSCYSLLRNLVQIHVENRIESLIFLRAFFLYFLTNLILFHRDQDVEKKRRKEKDLQ